MLTFLHIHLSSILPFLLPRLVKSLKRVARLIRRRRKKTEEEEEEEES
jgi:hypothetical protein